MNKIENETQTQYRVDGNRDIKVKLEPIYSLDVHYTINTSSDITKEEQLIIDTAIVIVNKRAEPGISLNAPKDCEDYLQLKYRDYEYEVFSCIWLDNRNRIIDHEEMSRGTIDGASVYPREVVKSALYNNAKSVIFAHNHPSGESEASQSDKIITQSLKDALALIDVSVLDHIIVGKEMFSFAERGLL